MKTLLINTHLTYPGWSEGKLNLSLMLFDILKQNAGISQALADYPLHLARYCL